jgi:uncharacterized protein (TIGR02246 family)
MNTEEDLNNIEQEMDVRALYTQYIDYWNNRNAEGMAGLLRQDALLIGFDGSEMQGPEEARSFLSQIFNDHLTAAYVSVVKSVRFLSGEAALLHAIVGMVPSGYSDINPRLNALQTLAAVKTNNKWQIALFQNTPAALHGQPEKSAAMLKELREAYLKSL